MSIKRKSGYEIKLMREAGRVVALVHQEMKNIIKPGVTTKYLDDVAYQIIKDNHCDPSCLGYNGFPATICASVNEQVVHGIPSDKVVLKDGDVITVDVCATFRGYVGDSAWSYGVGEISDECKRLLTITEKSLYAGLEKFKDGNLLDDVSGAIEDVANENHLGIIRHYGGHGVGENMHEEPFVFNYRTNNPLVLKKGMTIAIEPMLTLGGDDVDVLDDDWTVVTRDKSFAAHFEHTCLVTDKGADILTKL